MRFIFILFIFSYARHLNAQDYGCSAGDCDNGIGRFIFQNGDKYVGEFKNGRLNGNGLYISKNGHVYKGQFKDNFRQGYGIFKWSNGDSYIGEYQHNERHGEGTFFGIDGTVKEGFWEKGVFIEPNNDLTDSIFINIHLNDTNIIGKNKNSLESDNILMALSNISPSQKRNALVIGNANYPENSLKNASNDAIAISEALRHSGFNVMLRTDLTQKELKIIIRDFGKQLKEAGGIGLFYFAGHGLQEAGRNYLLPVDADIRKSEDIEFEAVDLSRILVEMDYAENDLNIIILDACRDNPYKDAFKDSRNRHNGLASIQSAPYNSFIAFSTSPGSIASDNPDANNGLYTEQLLDAIQMKGVKLEDIFKTVRAKVRKLSNGLQIPWEISSVEDDFYFRE